MYFVQLVRCSDLFARFWTHFRATSTPSMQKRFVETVLDYAEGALNQVRNREKGQISWSIEGSIANRRDTSAVEVSTLLIKLDLFSIG